MTDQQVDDFLAHYGKKGMRWGVRNAEDDSAPRASRLSDDQKRRLKTAAKVAGTVAVIGGIVATAYILQKNGKLPAFSIPRPKPSAPSLDGLNTVKLNTVKLNKLKPKKLGGKEGGPSLMEKVQVGMQFADIVKGGMKEKPPKLDPDLQQFMNDSAKRQAADNAAFKSNARKQLDEIEQDPFILNYMRGKNPEALARLREDSR